MKFAIQPLIISMAITPFFCQANSNDTSYLDLFYLGGDFGGVLAQDQAAEDGLGLKTYSVYFGGRISEQIYWDLRYQNVFNLEANNVNADVDVFDVGLKYRYLFNDSNFSVFGRVGISHWNLTRAGKLITKERISDESPTFDVGFGYRLSPSLDLTSSYRYIDKIGSASAGRFDAHSWVFGITYSFGSRAVVSDIDEHIEEVPTPFEVSENTKPIIEQDIDKKEVLLKNDLQDDLEVYASEPLNIRFATNSSIVTQYNEKQLSEIHSLIERYPDLQVYLIGHTDSSGQSKYNLWMSQRRAEAVSDMFIKHGISSKRIHAKGVGEKFASKKSNEPSDRRVQVILAIKKSSD
ncbi:OmpA family protein [Vibrio mimicus]